jgi:hypothetical protein
MRISISDLKLDDLGRVVLDDEILMAIDSMSVSLAGGDGQTNAGVCSNSATCAQTTNGQCTNANNQCSGAVNRANCIPGQQNQREVELEG